MRATAALPQLVAREPSGPGDTPLIRVPALLAAFTVVVLVLGAWSVAYAAGGSQTVFPHLFYAAIVFASFRFGLVGAIPTALMAGVFAGPVLPADVASGEAQEPVSWLLRTSIFLGCGLLVAWLTGHTSTPLGQAVRDRRTSSRLRAAIRHDEIVVHYQPIVSLSTAEVMGVEALARWDRPGRGLLPPSEFIPAAERTGEIADLDKHVLRTATQQLAAWEWAAESMWVAVNVSASRLVAEDLVDDVRGALDESGLSPQRLHLEITETAIIRDVPAAAKQIRALREMRVRVAIDDFGAGQTSLANLHDLAVDVVKIDRALVSRTVSSGRAARLVAG
ncbi:MAG TPA: EAL domain-containing protein, partial [Nocardioidaceae bacterium]|nr:EAL domain-containing protein [Nocardioidaceae bacterium]